VKPENRKPIPPASGGTAGKNQFQNLSEDAQGLGPTRAGSFIIGRVDNIVGEGGAEVAGYTPTRNELLQLARYWFIKIIDLDFTHFLYGCTGSSEWRTRQFANRRLNRIAELIGHDDTTEALEDAKKDYSLRVDQRAWRIFVAGSREEQEALQSEVQARMEQQKPGSATQCGSNGVKPDARWM
jgi:hypothetical protein